MLNVCPEAGTKGKLIKNPKTIINMLNKFYDLPTTFDCMCFV